MLLLFKTCVGAYMKSYAFWDKYREMAGMHTLINREHTIKFTWESTTPSLTVSDFRKILWIFSLFFLFKKKNKQKNKKQKTTHICSE